MQFRKLNATLQQHATELAVLQAQLAVTKASQEPGMPEIREMDRRIFQKLDSIGTTLRKECAPLQGPLICALADEPRSENPQEHRAGYISGQRRLTGCPEITGHR